VRTGAYVFTFLVAAAAAGLLVATQTGRLGAQPSLTVTSQPRASVYLNGRYQGLTPLKIDNLPAGAYALRCTREGHRAHVEQVSVQGPTTREVALDPVARARLTVQSRPEAASVYVDGTLRGRTPCTVEDLAPGTHHVEVLKANHVAQARAVDLGHGADRTESFVLEHRQKQAYRARIERDPYDIAAYNDLGELLCVLERFEDAAEVFVQGYIRASASRDWSATQRYNIQRLPAGARRMHQDPDFQRLLDRKVMAAVREGEDAHLLLADFGRIEWRRYTETYRTALEGLLSHHSKNPSLVLRIAGLFGRCHAFDRAAAVVDQAVALAPRNAHVRVEAIRELNDILSNRRQDAVLAGRQRRYIQETADLSKNRDQNARYLYEQARFAYVEERDQEGHDLMHRAIDAHPNDRTANAWRLDLAQRYLRDKDYAHAGPLLREILDKGDRRDPARRQAARLIRSVPKQHRNPQPADE